MNIMTLKVLLSIIVNDVFPLTIITADIVRKIVGSVRESIIHIVFAILGVMGFSNKTHVATRIRTINVVHVILVTSYLEKLVMYSFSYK